MNKLFKAILALCVSACMALILISPETYISSAGEGIKLWALTVVPSLLPFFFFTAVLSKTGVTEKTAKLLECPCRKIFKTGGIASYVFLTSVLSGYPVGAKIIGDLGENNVISPDEATKMSTFCCTSGPIFIVGCVGTGMFGSPLAGKILFFSHILSAILTGICFRFSGKAEPDDKARPLLKNESGNVLYDCVYSSVISVATVGGFICVFYLLADVFENLNLLYPLGKLLSFITSAPDVSAAFSYGLIECTRGCKALSECGLSAYSLTFASSLIAFGGVSVIVQSICFLKKADVKIYVFLLAKLLQTVFAFLICLLAITIFPLGRL